jgi:hypothetical protein
MKYDQIDWHSSGDYPKELPYENGGIHIGMFLCWAINNNLEGELHKNESQDSLKQVLNREMTGLQFLLRECDEKFTDEDLNDEGNYFTKFYFESDNYLIDYEEKLGANVSTLYHVEDTWENFDTISKQITKRFQKWKGLQYKQWWEFWK